MRLLGVRIETPDVAAAVERYATLLGVAPVTRADGARRFALERGLVELAEGAAGQATILFARERPDDGFASDPAAHGVAFRVEDDVAAAPAATGLVGAIDHVVIFTPDPPRTIACWRDANGLRLAFDKEFPERRIRLMFFRSGADARVRVFAADARRSERRRSLLRRQLPRARSRGAPGARSSRPAST